MWGRFAILLIASAVALVPVAVVVWRAFEFGPGGVAAILRGPALAWFGNSLAVTGATVVVSLVVAAPAAYVLSRGRSRLVDGYSLVVFALQSFPVFLAVVPLFVLFARAGLVDSLPGLTLVYIGTTVATVVFMLTTAIDAIPRSLEEAAWMDGCSVAGAFVRIVLRNCLPGLASAGVFAFLLAWNEYLVALIFLRSTSNYTLGIGLSAAGGSPALAVLMMLPPIAVFLIFRRHFSVGGVAGALAGT